MMAFWPNASQPTHLVACIEEFNRQTITPYANGNSRYNPSVQTIDLKTREVRTVLRGMAGCDGIRVTWGTVLATEEDGSTRGDGHLGGAYDILNPLAFEEGNLVNRRSSDVVDPNGNLITGQVAYRGALPTMSWESIAVLPNGVVIAGDELRPGTITDDFGSMDTDGCVKILRLKDQSAEPTGFIFSADGRTAWMTVQHSADLADGSMNREGWGTDDLIRITGFKVKKHH